MFRAGLLLLAVCCVSADWPVFRGTPDGLGVGTAKLPEQLQELWTFKTGNGIEGAVAVSEGIVYVGSADKHLYALDVKTGQQKWKKLLGSAILASPAVRQDRVYIGCADGKFYCLKTKDGEKIWQVDVEGCIKCGANFHGENVLIGSRDIPLFCFDKDGKKVWEFPIDGGANGTPTVVGDQTFVAGCDSTFHIIDAKTGKELGNLNIDDQATATMAVVGERAYIGTGGKNQLLGLDIKNLKKLWSFEPSRLAQPFYSSAAVSEKLVIIGCQNKRLYALDRETGKEMWTFVADGQVDASPVIVGNCVYFGCLSNDGNFYVLDLKGKKIQELNLDSAVTGSPAVANDCIIVGTDKGTVYCLGAK
jgi:outer membrane protein assembly factor BamB